VHCLVLTPELFESTYLVSPGTVPEGNPKIIIDQIFALYKTEVEGENPREEFCEYRDEILDIMKNINYFQKLVDDKELTGDQKRLNKVCTPENIGYFNFLKQALQKTIISQEMYTNCQRAAERVKNHPEAASLLGVNEFEFSDKNVEFHRELLIDMTSNKLDFGFKGIVDSIKIDHDNKIIYVNDLKRISKYLKDFKESIWKFRYDIQAIVYCGLVSNKFSHLLIEQGYTIEFRFIVIDANNQCYCFKVSNDTMELWLNQFEIEIKKVDYHYSNKKYDLPYDFCTGTIEL